MLKTLAHRLLRSFGFDVVRYVPPAPPWPPWTYDREETEVMERVRPFTMTSDERISAMVRAARYVAEARVPGDVVECGVWRGGSTMAAAIMLLKRGVRDRSLHLFDTFEGMTAPTDVDVDYEGCPAEPRFSSQRTGPNASAWCYASLEEVEANLLSTGYPADRLHFVKGRVEDTLPAHAPSEIAILRLDTDWYESTLHELRHLYPRLAVGGVLIVDDYGHWEGCRKATDEYLATLAAPPMLCRLDYAAAIAVKR